jgi:Tol biopolymer transport system component
MWSPDGKHILFSSARLGFKDEAPLYDDIPQPYGELFVMNADGSGQRLLTDNQWEDATPAWAPVSLSWLSMQWSSTATSGSLWHRLFVAIVG